MITAWTKIVADIAKKICTSWNKPHLRDWLFQGVVPSKKTWIWSACHWITVARFVFKRERKSMDFNLKPIDVCSSNLLQSTHLQWRHNEPVTGEFPAQRVSNAEIVSIWWRHHDALKMSLISIYQENGKSKKITQTRNTIRSVKKPNP